jgi:hypothetical protein
VGGGGAELPRSAGRASRHRIHARPARGAAPFETEFARAWDTPGHTSYQLPDTYINKVLAACYATGGPLALTRAMLWQMEVRKAASPGSSQRDRASKHR